MRNERNNARHVGKKMRIQEAKVNGRLSLLAGLDPQIALTAAPTGFSHIARGESKSKSIALTRFL